MTQRNKDSDHHPTRRTFLKTSGISGLALLSGELITSQITLGASQPIAQMSPNEDLMQEHALLNRILLIYDEAAHRLQDQVNLDAEILKNAAQTIQRFIENYHEKNEEDYVFPRFEAAKKLVDLVTVLRQQHRAGRVLTQKIILLSNQKSFKDPAQRTKLIDNLKAFTQMYRPHEAREGSILYPAFRDLLPAQEFLDLGDRFERIEHQLLGVEGFEGQVQLVQELEKKLGIFDLAQFTPKSK